MKMRVEVAWSLAEDQQGLTIRTNRSCTSNVTELFIDYGHSYLDINSVTLCLNFTCVEPVGEKPARRMEFRFDLQVILCCLVFFLSLLFSFVDVCFA